MLAGKNVLLFGGLGLLGKKLVEAIASAGANVVVASRSAVTGAVPEAFADLQEQLRARISGVAADVSSPAEVASAFDFAQERHGRLHGVVNLAFPRNAAFGAKFEDVRYQDFCDNVTSHLGGAFLVCQKAAEVLGAQGGGVIINTSSIYGVMAPRFHIYDGTEMTKEVEYSLVKAAIVQLTEYLARYLKGRNIRVNCVSPGGIWNHQPDPFVKAYTSYCLNKGMLAAEDVVGAYLFLLSDQSSYVNGQNIVVDDGFSL